jgi:predicted DNA-binding transcriptional regulator
VSVDKEDKQGRRKDAKPRSRDALAGTTRRVYRYIYRHGPVRPHEIQRDLGLSSSSQADYHIQKLLKMKLIREEGGENGSAGGYVAEEAVFEAMVRIRRMVIPLWTTATAFFASALLVLLTFLRPAVIVSGLYLFSLVITVVALSISVYQAITSLSGNGI